MGALLEIHRVAAVAPNSRKARLAEVLLDTQMRAGEQYSVKWDYVRHNPVRAGLCQAPGEWPFQGELNALPWE
jgi:hypothetical protein